MVEPDEETRCRCPQCGQRGRPVETDVVRWRTLDVHGKRTFLESELPRIICGQHGKVTAAVPWARHDDRFSRPFEEFAAWKAAHMPWTRAAAELRVTWEALANITARVAADARPGWTGWRGCAGSGSTRSPGARGRTSTWSSSLTTTPGGSRGSARDAARPPSRRSSQALGEERAKALTHVSADGADWIHPVVREKAPQAQLCLDAFHVVKWAGEKLDELRRRIAGELRAAGRGDEAATLGAGMWALRKDQQKLTPGQRGTLAEIAVVNKPLYKGYLIKEQIREAFKVKGDQGKSLMRGVTAWAHRCRIPEFTRLARTLSRYKTPIEATLGGGPSNGRAEALNAQVNALITRARGFRSAAALMAMIDFVHGGLCPDSPYA